MLCIDFFSKYNIQKEAFPNLGKAFSIFGNYSLFILHSSFFIFNSLLKKSFS